MAAIIVEGGVNRTSGNKFGASGLFVGCVPLLCPLFIEGRFRVGSTGLPPLIRIRNHQNCRSSTLCRPRRRDREGAAESGPPTLEVSLSEKVAQCRQVHPPPAGEVARAVRWGDHLGRVPRVDPRMDQSRSLRRFVGPAPPRAGAAPARQAAMNAGQLRLNHEQIKKILALPGWKRLPAASGGLAIPG